MAASMDNVEVRKLDEKKGRGLYARRSFQQGQVILEEVPLVSCQFAWNELYRYTACEYCVRSLEPAEAMARRLTDNPALVLPHPECCEVKLDKTVNCPHCQVLYCCEECRTRAWNRYHQRLCLGPARLDPDHPCNKLLETWRNIHYPPETASIALMMKMVAMVIQILILTGNKDLCGSFRAERAAAAKCFTEQLVYGKSQDPAAMMGEFGRFVHTTVNDEEQHVHKLLGKQFQESFEILRSQLTELFPDGAVQQWTSPEGLRSAFALMGTNQQGIGSSSISVWVKNCDALQLPADEREHLDQFIDQMYEDLDRVSGAFLNCEGAGLYKLQSACNHSCVPNAEINFTHQDHTLSLVALEEIQPEQEICISYLDDCCKDRGRHSRHKFLRENYLFTCNCPKCLSQADDEDVTSEDDDEDEDEEDMDESAQT